MTITQRFSLIFSLLFSILLATAMFTIYYSFKNFREQEFRSRLLQKAETTIKLLLEVKEVDDQLLKIIDKNSINRLYDEKTLIFDTKLQLIYKSIDDIEVHWTRNELLRLKNKRVTFKRYGKYDIIGLYHQFNKSDYYVLISAEDRYGNTKLNFLTSVLLTTFLAGIVLVWVLSFYLSKRSLQPLGRFTNEIQEITDRNLNKRLPESQRNDELKALSHSFNQMMDRIDDAYQRQKEFTGNASHELRTPIAKILAQLENAFQDDDLPESIKTVLLSITEDTSQLSEIVTSLLLLSEIHDKEGRMQFQMVRLDEIIFYSASKIREIHSDFVFQFEIDDRNNNHLTLEIEGDEILLQIAFINLIRNGYLYSDDKVVKCLLTQKGDNIEIVISNTGDNPGVKDPSELFSTFKRGNNTKSVLGNGVGLSIVKRILNYHQASTKFIIPADNMNQIEICFPF